MCRPGGGRRGHPRWRGTPHGRRSIHRGPGGPGGRRKLLATTVATTVTAVAPAVSSSFAAPAPQAEVIVTSALRARVWLSLSPGWVVAVGASALASASAVRPSFFDLQGDRPPADLRTVQRSEGVLGLLRARDLDEGVALAPVALLAVHGDGAALDGDVLLTEESPQVFVRGAEGQAADEERATRSRQGSWRRRRMRVGHASGSTGASSAATSACAATTPTTAAARRWLRGAPSPLSSSSSGVSVSSRPSWGRAWRCWRRRWAPRSASSAFRHGIVVVVRWLPALPHHGGLLVVARGGGRRRSSVRSSSL